MDLKENSENLRLIRENQPRVTLEEARKQAEIFRRAKIRNLSKKRLTKADLYKVNEPFRKTAEEALNRGEEVPYSVIYLSVAELTPSDVEWAKKVIAKYELTDS